MEVLNLNKIMFDLLMYVESGEPWNSRLIAQKLYKPYSVIDTEFDKLVKEGYINQGAITSKGRAYLQGHKITNAIILAAGVSSDSFLCVSKDQRGYCRLKEK